MIIALKRDESEVKGRPPVEMKDHVRKHHFRKLRIFFTKSKYFFEKEQKREEHSVNPSEHDFLK